MSQRHREYVAKKLREEKEKEKAAKKAADLKTKEKKEEQPAPPPPPNDVHAYYDSMSGGFYTANDHGEFQRIGKDILTKHLQAEGFNDKYTDPQGLTQVDRKLLDMVRTNPVHYAGPLGGYAPGYYERGGTRLLITTGPKPLRPKEGKWPTFRAFLDQLLGDQWKYFAGWLRWARHSFERGAPFNPGQALCLAGPPGCGKSFLQTLVTELLGGRVSKPYAFLTGRTEFNANIFAAEHALVGDEIPNTDIKSRRNFGAAIKSMVVNKEQHIRAMYQAPLTLCPFVRMTISLNDNAESLTVLPPLDGDIRDKLILLKATPVAFPWPSKRFPDSQSFYAKLVSELPAFLYSLRRWRIPESIKCQRYGVVSWLNPELVREVDAMSPELRLWELIDEWLLEGIPGRDFQGTPNDFESALRDWDREHRSRRTEGLFNWSSACGTYLGRLCEKMPHAVSMRKAGGHKKIYRVVRPLEE